jgi:hypothetical protein
MVKQSITNTSQNGNNSPSNAAIATNSKSSYQPRTVLGRKLWEIRAKIVASGQPLLGREEIEREVIERRGETE